MRSFPKLLTFLSLLLLSISLMAGNRLADKTTAAKAREFLNNQPLEFIENKGQFTNTEGKPADEILFKASFGNCDIYITDKGLSYVFAKIDGGSPKTDDQRIKIKTEKQDFGKRKKSLPAGR